MSTNKLDARIENLRAQIDSAMSSGGTKDFDFPIGTPTVPDFTTVVYPLLDAYRHAVQVNPAKAFAPKPVPAKSLENPAVLGDKDFWSDLWGIVQQVAPIIIGALTKDFNPSVKSLKQVVAELPPNLRDDPEFRAYATELLLYTAQHTMGALSGAKNYTDPKNVPAPPQPPAGKDFWSDAWNFVRDAIPVVAPIILSLL
ncbi:hypothetical protein Q0Z83_023080 [Actinoplanes sichuanensis]|uniref:Uncharacterized protein n=1 Tax=Actinoplanes sichuanensis TaxID=512349 RepID=A0ABW4A0L6_9ACTN|nr:hypothetical protein [Actinoplanes sichuanensis]BEL04117.1 hypothetical protein Q0Z83_023080 [Actinoplanes sichuanensis]